MSKKEERLYRRYRELAALLMPQETAARQGDKAAARRADRINREMTRIEKKLGKLRKGR